MKLVLLGAPGSGKGTLAQKLIKKLNIPTISTGDLLRTSIANQTEIGLEAKKYMDAGALVPTEIVLKMLEQRLSQKDTKNGYILDGFPRTIEQAELLENMTEIDTCLYLDVDKDIIVERLSGRRTCADCGTVYNASTYTSDKCECGGELYVRDDDKPETIAKRFDTFTEKTQPLVSYYEKKGVLKTVKGQDDPMDTFKKALEVLNEENLSNGDC